jgi:hypothetical protein
MQKVGLKQAENNALLEVQLNLIRRDINIEESFLVDTWVRRVLGGTEVLKKNLDLLARLGAEVYGPSARINVPTGGGRGNRGKYVSTSQMETAFRIAAESISEYDPSIEKGNVVHTDAPAVLSIEIPIVVVNFEQGQGLPFPSKAQFYIGKLNRIYRYLRKLQVLCKEYKIPVTISAVTHGGKPSVLGAEFRDMLLKIRFDQALRDYVEEQPVLPRLYIDPSLPNAGAYNVIHIINRLRVTDTYTLDGYRSSNTIPDLEIDTFIASRAVLFLEEFIQVAKTLNRLREDSLSTYFNHE